MNTTRFANNASNTRRNNNQNGSGVASRNGNTHSNNHASGNRKPYSNAAPSNAAAASSSAAAVGAPSMESLESLKVSPSATIPTLDPTSQAGLMMVPVTKTYDTKGRTEFFQGLLKKEVSLCCLFQKGRCHAGDKCHQIHVESNFIKNVRAQNAHVISCCRSCKDTASLSADAVTFFATYLGSEDSVKIVSQDGRYSTVKPENVAITTGLIQHAEQLKAGQPMSTLPAKKMCRLHLRGACKYGKDCKNVHLCSKLGEAVLSPTHSPVPEERRSSVSSTASSRVATPTPASVASTQRRNSSSGIMDRASAAAPTATATATTSRRNSTASTVSSDAPKDYFSAQRFTTPPPMAVGALSRSGSLAPVPEQDAEEEDALAKGSRQISEEEVVAVPEKKRRLSFSQVDLSDVSFMENSVQIPNLCFDPTLALSWDDVPKAMNGGHKKNQLSADWLVDDMASACGCSSTTSQKSHTPTPSKMAVW